MSSKFQRARNAVRAQFNRNLLHLGDYEVERTDEYRLGQGGFGSVWRGKNMRTKEIVAVKQVERRPETEKFIEREIKLLQQCDHENIVKLYEHFEEKEWVYFVMEYCENGDLDKFMKDREIGIDNALSFIKDVTCAVDFLHTLNTLHRDIKPVNILVRDSKRCVLADLGLSRYIPDSEISATLTAVGTKYWMAPDVLDNHYGPPVDIFSVGLVILAIVRHQKGRNLLPHTENDKPLCYWMEEDRSVTSLADDNDDRVTQAVKALVLQMICFDPSKRPSMKHVHERILHIIDMRLRVEKLSEKRLGFDADPFVGMSKSGHVLVGEDDSPHNLHNFLLQDDGSYSEQWTQPQPQQLVSDWCRKYFCEDQSILLQDRYSAPTRRTRRYTATLQHVDKWSQEGDLVQCLPPSHAVYCVKEEGRWKLVVREEDGSRTTLSPSPGHKWSDDLSVCETPARLVVLDARPGHYFLTTFPPGKPSVTTPHEGTAGWRNGVCCWEDLLLVACWIPPSVRIHSSSGRLLQTLSHQQLQLRDVDMIRAVGVSGQRLMAAVGPSPGYAVSSLFVYELSYPDEALAAEEGATAAATTAATAGATTSNLAAAQPQYYPQPQQPQQPTPQQPQQPTQQHPPPQQPQQPTPQQEQAPPQPPAPPPLIGPVYKAMYDFKAQEDVQVSFQDGDVIIDIEDIEVIDGGWMLGTVQRTGKRGLLPVNYVEKV